MRGLFRKALPLQMCCILQRDIGVTDCSVRDIHTAFPAAEVENPLAGFFSLGGIACQEPIPVPS